MPHSEPKRVVEDLKLHTRILDSMAEGVSVSDERGVILYTNPAEDRMFGYEHGELVGQHVSVQNAYPPEENQRIVAEVIAQLRAHGEWSGEWSNKKKDGTPFTTRARITSLDLGGSPYWVCVQQDVTREREHEERLRVALAATALGTWDFRPLTGQLTWDARCKELFGLPPEAQVSHATFLERLQPEDRQRTDEAVQRALDPRGEGACDIEYRTVASSEGAPRWCRATGRAFFEGGRAVRFIGIIQDITEKKRTEREREELLAQAQAARAEAEAQRQRLHTLFTHAPAIIAIHRGPEHVFEFSNPIHSRLLGHRALLGKTVRQAQPDLEGQGFYELLDRVYHTGEPFIGKEARANVGSAEEPRTGYFNFVYQPMPGPSGGTDGVMVFGFEVTEQVLARQRAEEHITERKRAEAVLREAVQARDTFLSVAAHELRTPLTSLQLRLQQLRRELEATAREQSPRASVLRNLELGDAQVRRLAALVNELLDVARISQGRLSLSLEPVDFAELVSDVARRFEPQAERAGCRLEVCCGGPVVGVWDRLRLDQVVTNLLSNALKYGSGKPVQLTLQPGGERARLIVRDEGIGIEPTALSRIFEKFERAVSERHYGGLGLGLYVTRQIIEALGGTVSVESTPGQGATFAVELPLEPTA